MDKIAIQNVSAQTQTLIEQYLKLPIGVGINCPYFNNKRHQVRAGLRVYGGKGSITDIVDEVELLSMREKVHLEHLPSEKLKQFLVLHHIGIDCSGFAYHILNEESKARGKGGLRTQLSFNSVSPIRKIITFIRPVENTNVAVLADPANSTLVDLWQTQAADFLAVTFDGGDKSLNHILIIEKIEDHGQQKILHYVHSFAWPNDGQYGHGVRRGSITLNTPDQKLEQALWREKSAENQSNYTRERVLKARHVSMRRLRWF